MWLDSSSAGHVHQVAPHLGGGSIAGDVGDDPGDLVCRVDGLEVG
jgi:hypothetical protein